jgi:hypothetical protein
VFTPDDFWRIFNLLKDGTMDPALDTNTKILAGSEQSISEKLFSNNIDQNAHLSDDYNRIRKFLVDWYASHRTLTSSQKHITDVYSIPANDINELLKSFGFDYGLKLVPLRNRATLFLNIVALYKKKGTPGALADILSYFGFLDASIVEYWLVKDSLGNLVFRGENVRTETEGGTTLLDEDVTFDIMTTGDPHWMLSYSQVETLISQNKINLPSKTAYFSLSSVFHLNSLEGPIAILSRIVQEEYNRKFINDEDLLQSITIRGLSSIVSVLELHLAVNYVMHIMFGYTETSDANILCFNGTVIYDTATPRSITNIDDIMVQYYNYFNTTKFTRDERATLLTNYFDDFTRPISSTFIDSTSTVELVLDSISPDFKQELDDWITQGEQVQLITYLLSALDKYIRTNIDSSIPSLVVTILGFAFQEEVIDIIKFFKPFRARLAFLDTSYAIDNILTESVRFDDSFDTTLNQYLIDTEDVTEDYIQTIKNYFTDSDIFERIDFKDWDSGGIFDDSVITNILEVVDVQINQVPVETITVTDVIKDPKVVQIIPDAKGWQPPTSYDTGSTFDDPTAVQTPIVSDSVTIVVTP